MRSSSLYFAALAGPIAARAASGSGQSTRYWDCCKPSCSWNDKASVSAPVLTCDKNDNPISDVNAVSGCNGGSSFTCSNNSPWAVNDNLAYGFAATKLSGGSESSWCCACYALTFTTGPVKGKTMVVQSTNTGGDLGDNHFDIQMPGGGLGIFDGCTAQWGGLGGARYGGVSSRSECDSYPELLKDGCYWRFDWFENADNPDFTFEQVQCPKALTDITGCVRNDDSNFPAFSGVSDTPSNDNKGKSSTSKASATKAPASKTSAKATVPATQKTSAPVVKSSSKAQQPSNPQSTQKNQNSAQPQKTSAAASQKSQTPSTKKGTKTRSGCAIPSKHTSTAKTPANTNKASSKPSATKSAASTTESVVAIYHQCGGSKEAFPNGNLPCAQGSKCVFANDWYSQCQPN